MRKLTALVAVMALVLVGAAPAFAGHAAPLELTFEKDLETPPEPLDRNI